MNDKQRIEEFEKFFGTPGQDLLAWLTKQFKDISLDGKRELIKLNKRLNAECAKQVKKATKQCKNCNGKGYNTIMEGSTTSPDFIGEKRTFESVRPRVKICCHCNCDRGKQLMKYFDVKKGKQSIF